MRRMQTRQCRGVCDSLAGHGIATHHVAVEGHGSRELVADNKNDAGRAKKRRG